SRIREIGFLANLNIGFIYCRIANSSAVACVKELGGSRDIEEDVLLDHSPNPHDQEKEFVAGWQIVERDRIDPPRSGHWKPFPSNAARNLGMSHGVTARRLRGSYPPRDGQGIAGVAA